jgi:hypothetical protein
MEKGEEEMPERPELKIELPIEVWCSCGIGLCEGTEIRSRKGIVSLVVKPCPVCCGKGLEKSALAAIGRWAKDGGKT